MSAYTEFLDDPLREDTWLVEIYALELATGNEVVLRYSSRQFGTEPTDTPANEQYLPRVVGGFSYRMATVPANTVGVLPAREGGRVELRQFEGDLDAVFAPGGAYAVEGRRCIVRHGGRSVAGRLAYADFGVPFDGEIEQAECGLESVTLRLRDKSDRFTFPIETRSFYGGKTAIDLDGSTAGVSFGSPAKCDLQSEITVEGWLYHDTIGTNQALAAWGGGTARPWELWIDTTGNPRFGDSTGTLVVGFGITAAAGGWYHLAVKIDSSGARFILYDWNTATEDTYDVSGSFLSRPAASGATLYAGERAGARRLDGMLRELRVWSVARTDEEIREARFRQLSSGEAGDSTLALYCKFDDATGSTVVDSSSSPANGTAAGTYVWYPCLGGGVELEGRKLPNLWGYQEGVAPVLVDPFRQIYQFHSTTANGISTVYEGAYAGIAYNATYTDLKTFLAATTPAAKWDLLKYAGGSFLRLGSQAKKPISIDATGDATGSGYVSTPADIVRRIVTTRGPEPLADPGELDTASFTALNTASSPVVGLYLLNETRIDAAIATILRSSNAVAQFARATGKFGVRQFGAVTGTPVLSLDERDVLGDLSPTAVEIPLGEVVIRYRRNYLIHDEGAISELGATGERKQFAMKEWRTVTRRRESVYDTYPRARTLVVETALTDRDDAIELAEYLLNTFSSKGRGFKFTSRGLAIQLDRLDVVTFDYRELDSLGSWGSRFNLAGGLDFYVLGFSGNGEDHSDELVLWRED